MKALSTVDEIIDALGGTGAVAVLLDCDPRVVSNWRVRGRIPAPNYIVISQALTERGLSAPPHLLGMEMPPQPSEAAA